MVDDHDGVLDTDADTERVVKHSGTSSSIESNELELACFKLGLDRACARDDDNGTIGMGCGREVVGGEEVGVDEVWVRAGEREVLGADASKRLGSH